MPGGTFVDGLHLPECPRWHDGALWLSDMWAHEVLRVDAGGAAEVVHRFPDDEDPGGLGWLPDGTMLVVGMEGRVLYRLEDGEAVVHADLRDLAPFQLNDMVVAPNGTAYVTQFGFDMWGGGTFATSSIIRVDADGTAEVAAADLAVPNGIAVSEDGDVLVVAEPGAGRISRYAVTDGRNLHGRTTHALEKADGAPYVTPDGICLDGTGLWFADPIGHRVVHVDHLGEPDQELLVEETHPLACVLGGPDRRTLFVTTSEQHHKPSRTGEPTGAVLAVEVDVPGTGRP